MAFDPQKIRTDFPILSREINGKPMVYLDNAATTQKPKSVIDNLVQIYTEENSNIHRSANSLADELTLKFENSRKHIQAFINAKSEKEVIFTSGTTQSINTLAFTIAEKHLREGDNVVITALEHHANIVPWQMACKRKNAELRILPVTKDLELDESQISDIIDTDTKLVSCTRISNATGAKMPVYKLIAAAKQVGALSLVDAAQSIQHEETDVQDLDCDFLVFSGHKIYGPNGIGVLYGKEAILNELPPFQTGGEMISKVSYEETTFNELPYKFEAGTPNYLGAIGLSEAIRYIENIGLQAIQTYEQELYEYARQKIQNIEGAKIYGKKELCTGLVSFNIEGIHSYDIGQIIDKMGVILRTGSHCADPVMEHLGVSGTIRASFCFYNTKEEIDYLCQAINRAKSLF